MPDADGGELALKLDHSGLGGRRIRVDPTAKGSGNTSARQDAIRGLKQQHLPRCARHSRQSGNGCAGRGVKELVLALHRWLRRLGVASQALNASALPPTPFSCTPACTLAFAFWQSLGFPNDNNDVYSQGGPRRRKIASELSRRETRNRALFWAWSLESGPPDAGRFGCWAHYHVDVLESRVSES